MEEGDAQDPKFVLGRPYPHETYTVALDHISRRGNVVDVVVYLNADLRKLVLRLVAAQIEHCPGRISV